MPIEPLDLVAATPPRLPDRASVPVSSRLPGPRPAAAGPRRTSGPPGRLGGGLGLAFLALLGIVIVFATDQVVPASSDHQAAAGRPERPGCGRSGRPRHQRRFSPLTAATTLAALKA
jgi:hypothetical protein